MGKLKITVKSLEDVAENARDFYEEQEDGTFMLQAEPDAEGNGIGPIASLRGKLDKTQKKLDKVQGMLLEKEDGSLWTVEEIDLLQSDIEKLRKAGEAGGKDAKDLEKQIEIARSELKKEHITETNRLKADNERLRKNVMDTIAEREVQNVMSEMKVLPEWAPLLKNELLRHVTVEEVEGKMKTRFIKPEDGSTRFSTEQFNDGPMDYKEFARTDDIREKFAKCLEGDGKAGVNDVSSRTSQNGRDIYLSQEEYGNLAVLRAAKEKAKAQGGQVYIRESK